MSSETPTPARPAFIWTLLHGLLLVAVWATYAALGLATSIRTYGVQPGLVAGYGLFFLYSCTLGFLFHRKIQRDHWLLLPMGRALTRIVAGVAVVGLIQAFLVYAVQFLLTQNLTGLTGPFFAFLLWLNSSLVTGLTTTIFCTAAFFLRLKAARDHARSLELNVSAARLSALEAQMNPHFLFNALNSLRGMISENPAVAQDMVTRLANILRHSLARDPGQPCRFQEEFETVQDYLSLEGIRFDDRLRASYRIDDRVSDFSIPALALQTLVENAVKHGITPRHEGGCIELTAQQLDASRWEVVVTNSGRLSLSSSTGTRVGLRNLRERLHLLYGDQASFALSDAPDGSVRASLCLPIVRLT